MWYSSVVCLINVSFFPKDISFLKDGYFTWKKHKTNGGDFWLAEEPLRLQSLRWACSRCVGVATVHLSKFQRVRRQKKNNNLQASVLLWWSWTPTNRMLFPSPQTVRVPVWTPRRPHFRLCETLPQALISIVYRRANRATFSSHHSFIAIPSIP